MKREDIAALRPLERKALLEDVAALVHSGEWRFGEAVRFLRAVVLGRTRQDFARLVGLSLAALQKLEDRADANPTLNTLNRVLRPFGGAVGLVFPGMQHQPLRDEEVERRREVLRSALHATRRQKSVR